jgi:hypothetical protein
VISRASYYRTIFKFNFKIKEGNLYRLIEIKGTNHWYFESLKNGILELKTIAAQKYSHDHGYLPFKMELNYE